MYNQWCFTYQTWLFQKVEIPQDHKGKVELMEKLNMSLLEYEKNLVDDGSSEK